MEISCPHCNFSREVDPDKIPSQSTNATCPSCGERFEVDFAKLNSEKRDAIDEREQDMDSSSEAHEASSEAHETWADDEVTVPWENDEIGFLSALIRNTAFVLFNPGQFFAQMPIDRGYKAPYTYGLLVGSLGIIVTAFWSIMFIIGMTRVGLSDTSIFSQIPQLENLSTVLGFQIAGMIFFMILSPVFYTIRLILGSIWAHFFLILVLGNKGGFQATFRVLSYQTAAQLFNFVPLVGGLISYFWGLVLKVMGLASAHDIGVLRVAFALIFLPFILMVLTAGAVIYKLGLMPF